MKKIKIVFSLLVISLMVYNWNFISFKEVFFDNKNLNVLKLRAVAQAEEPVDNYYEIITYQCPICGELAYKCVLVSYPSECNVIDHRC